MLRLLEVWERRARGGRTIAAKLQLNSLLAPHFQSFTGGDEPMMELDVYENPFRTEITPWKFELKNGDFDVPTTPYLGIEINEEVVKKYLVKG